MKTDKYHVTKNPRRNIEVFVHHIEKDFIVAIDKAYRDASRSNFTYCVFPLYSDTHNMIMAPQFGEWALSKAVKVKDFEDLVIWYLTEHLNYKEVHFTLMIDGGKRYGTEYREINFIGNVFEFSNSWMYGYWKIYRNGRSER